MEDIFNAIDENPDLLFFRIINEKGIRKGIGKGEDSEEVKELIEAQIEGLSPGTYKVLLGRANNLSEARAAEIFELEIESEETNKPTNRSKKMDAIYTREDIELAEKKAYQSGLQEARYLNFETRLKSLEDDFKSFKNIVREIAEAVDELDGEKDGFIGDKAISILNAAKDAKDLMTDFNF